MCFGLRSKWQCDKDLWSSKRLKKLKFLMVVWLGIGQSAMPIATVICQRLKLTFKKQNSNLTSGIRCCKHEKTKINQHTNKTELHCDGRMWKRSFVFLDQFTWLQWLFIFVLFLLFSIVLFSCITHLFAQSDFTILINCYVSHRHWLRNERLEAMLMWSEKRC